MQFKYPELLWALLLLLIPIFIHLFQLRRFKKTPFTNVKVLQRVQSESRKSNQLKKWLLLVTRLLLLAAIIIAFAQPFFALKTALQDKETVIYLDDSFSTEAKLDNTTLFENAVQELIKSIPSGETFSLFTNDKVFRKVTIQDIQNDLLTLEHGSKQLGLNEVGLKGTTLFGTMAGVEKNLVLISDFQQRMASQANDSSNTIRKHLVQLSDTPIINISIDSVYLEDVSSEKIDLTTLLSANTSVESTPVSLYDGNKLIAKTSAVFNTNRQAKVEFTIPPNLQIKGKIEISDTGLPYDNTLFFNLDRKEKIKVLSVNSANDDFLKRIFNDKEFEYSNFGLQNLDYSKISGQNLIVLNELESIPSSLATSLRAFTNEGGSLVVIPGERIDFDSYNALLINQMGTTFTQQVSVERNIVKINFSHPLFRDVFEKNVTNFQYPKVSGYWRIKTSQPTSLGLQGNDPFLVGSNGKYLFTAAINSENSNFKNSPLIVPTLYNMGINSLKLPDLYQTIGSVANIDVPIKLGKDEILKVSKPDYEFIPQQRSLANKVGLSFQENEIPDGIYAIVRDKDTLGNISFNQPRDESQLNYIDLSTIQAESQQTSVATFFSDLEKDSTINELWKWFVILALLFLMVEILIQKFL